MKADSGSWLYILLSIVFLIISAISNKNKKKATTSTPPINDDYEPPAAPEHRKPKNFEEVLSEFLDLPKPQEVVAEQSQSQKREIILESEENTYENIENEAQSQEAIEQEVFSYETSINEKKVEKSSIQPILETKTEEKSEKNVPLFNRNEFDLRQGIIYAEILNRKYF